MSRKLYPNVDFYTGLIYQAMGFPTKMFTVLFALGRAAWLDRPVARDDQGRRAPSIGRPRQIYTGAVERDFIPVEER